jgi:DNA-binding NarL/FixJ family response regulator
VSDPVRVVVADDQTLVRTGFRMILTADGIDVVAEATTGTEAVDAVRRTCPDVVLMDIRMPRLDGLAATQRLSEQPDAPAVIVLTTFDADEYVVRALANGATGFLLKDTSPPMIVEAIQRVAAGEPMLSPSVTTQLIRRVVETTSVGSDSARACSAAARLANLSEREHDVAVAVGHGKSNADIANELFMSVATVKAHVSHILVKLDAANRVQVAICVHEAGLI